MSRTEAQKAWFLKNRHKIKEYNDRWNGKNKGRRAETIKQWKLNNKDKVAAATKMNRKKDPLKHKLWRWRTAGYPEPTRAMPKVCECCGGPPMNRYGTPVFHLDHCHETGAFRGWLCNRCNLGIGNLGDNEAGLEAALAYLRKAKSSLSLRAA